MEVPGSDLEVVDARINTASVAKPWADGDGYAGPEEDTVPASEEAVQAMLKGNQGSSDVEVSPTVGEDATETSEPEPNDSDEAGGTTDADQTSSTAEPQSISTDPYTILDSRL